VQLLKDRGWRRLRYLHVNSQNQKVRQAMAYAINRQRLVDHQKNIFQNYAVAKGPVPADVIYYDKNLAGQYYHPERARRLLEEAGFPQGRGLPEYPFISLPDPKAFAAPKRWFWELWFLTRSGNKKSAR